MTQKLTKPPSTLRWAAAVGAAAILLCRAALGQTITNPSFEIDTFTNWPGYISLNTPITDWAASMPDRAGLNPLAGTQPAGDTANPFADNGAIPDGNNVAFIQSGVNPGDISGLTNTISGLTVGTTYKVVLRANARNGGANNGTGQQPDLRIAIDGTEILALNIYSVAAAAQYNAPYSYIAFEFTAAAASQTLALANDVAPTDATVLVDDVTVAPSSGDWVVNAWTSDSDSGVDSKYLYTHAYNFGSGSAVTINGVTFTGVTGASPAVAGRFSTTFTANMYNNSPNNNLTGSSHALANDFVYGGTIPAGQYESITMTGLTPGTKYVATVYSTAWDGPSLSTRWVTFSLGQDWLTVNQDQFGVGNGITVSYTYTADATGSATIKISPIDPQNISFHLCGFSNREAVSRDVAPVITTEPVGTVVSPGLSVVFTAAATGIPAPTYQWQYNGKNISGAQSASYTIASANSAVAGNYDVVAANSVGSVTSAVAVLTLGTSLVANPSFEVDTFTVWPGYASGNTPITGWTLGSLGGGGLNPANGSPFADNGAIPNGVNVAFIQGSTYLGQVVSNLIVGSVYSVHYYENARTVTTVPWIEVQVGGSNGTGGLSVVAPHPIHYVGDDKPYYDMYSEVFTATNTDLELDFIKSDPTGGDSSALLDNITLLPIAPGTAPFVPPNGNPQPALASVGGSATFSGQGVGSPPLGYQWLMNGAPIAGATTNTLTLGDIQKPEDGNYSLKITNSFGSATTEVVHLTVYQPVPSLFNTGVDSNHVVLADGSIDPHYKFVENPDSASPNAIVEDSSVFPISTATWMSDTTTSKWIGPDFNTGASAANEYTYRVILDMTDRDPSTLAIIGHWASDNEGLDIRVNGTSTHNPESLSFSSFTGFSIYGTNALYATNLVAGSNNLDFVLQNDGVGYTGLRVEFIQSNLLIPPGVPPTITTPLLSETVLFGSTVTFTATVSGSAPLSYQWEKNGAPIPGQTNVTLTLTSVNAASVGSYSFQVSNSVGSTNSAAATLGVLQPVPGNPCFGTGLAADGSFLAVNATDPHYALVSSADPGFPGPGAVVVSNAWPIAAGVWVLNGPNSQWIAPQADQSGATYPDGSYGGNYEGAYVYETTFDLAGYDLSKVIVGGGWAADNGGTNIVLNGISSGLQTPGFGALTPFYLTGTNGLVAGPNTLDFQMYNAGTSWNPTGVRVDIWALEAATAPPTLQILRAGAEITISWSPSDSTHHLQSAPAVTGPWTVIPGAKTPFTTNAASARVFYSIAP